MIGVAKKCNKLTMFLYQFSSEPVKQHILSKDLVRKPSSSMSPIWLIGDCVWLSCDMIISHLVLGGPSTSHKSLVINHFGTAICRCCKINEPALTMRIKQATHRWINVQLHHIWLAFKPDIFQIIACSSTEDQRKAQG